MKRKSKECLYFVLKVALKMISYLRDLHILISIYQKTKKKKRKSIFQTSIPMENLPLEAKWRSNISLIKLTKIEIKKHQIKHYKHHLVHISAINTLYIIPTRKIRLFTRAPLKVFKTSSFKTTYLVAILTKNLKKERLRRT